jgi:hypothetical protein
MHTNRALENRVGRMQDVLISHIDGNTDAEALALITASLSRSLSLLGGTLLEEEQVYTPHQQAILARFEQRYNCAGAKEDLLRWLEQKREYSEL